MAILEKLDAWKSPQLPAPREEPPDDPIYWLK
jgi:hypothetical protein